MDYNGSDYLKTKGTLNSRSMAVWSEFDGSEGNMASFNINRICCLLLLVLVEWTVPQNGKFYYFFLILYVAQPLCLGICPGDSQNSYTRHALTDVYTLFMLWNTAICLCFVISVTLLWKDSNALVLEFSLSLSTRTSYPVNPYIPLPPPKTEE